MENEKVLESLGLSEKEAKVYLAILQLGKGTVPSISRRAGTKRPTTYLILDELRKKDLVLLLPRKIKAIYTAKSPEVLLEEQKRKEHLIANKMPELLAIYNSQKEKPKIEFYQGEHRVIELYNKEIFKSAKIDFYGSISSIPKNIYLQIEKNLDLIEKNKIQVRELLQHDDKSIKFSKEFSSEFHQIKIIPENYKFPTDNVIYENRLAIFSYKSGPMAVIIESSDVVETYKSMFEIIWKSIE